MRDARSVAGRRVLLVRHGQTQSNLEQRWQGHIDTPLNETGTAQARAIGQRLAGWPIVFGASSDLSRSAETARLILEHHGIEPELTPLLREASLGVLQGRRYAEADVLLRDDADYLARLSTRARPPGGESPLDVRRRVRRFVRKLIEQEASLPPGDILVVAHSGSLRALMAVLLGLPPAAAWNFYFDNCTLSVVDWKPNGRSELRCHNDAGHLVG